MSVLDEMKKGDDKLSNHEGDMPKMPDWLDREKFDRGRKFFRDNLFSLFLAQLVSLVGGLSVRNLLEPLVFTGGSDDPRKAFVRYYHTFKHVCLWHYGDVWSSYSEASRSMMSVRRIHGKVAKDMNATSARNLYFSQYDMALVQCGFMGFVTLHPEHVGVPFNEAQLDDYIHFWRGLGYLLGISDEYNICTHGYADAHNKCKAIEDEVLLPALENPPKDCKKMADALVDGTNLRCGFRLNSYQAFMAFGYSALSKHFPSLSFVDSLRYYYIKLLVFLVQRFVFFRRMFNRNLERELGCAMMN